MKIKGSVSKRKPKRGGAVKRIPESTKIKALEMAKTKGVYQVSKELGLKANTIHYWVKKSNGTVVGNGNCKSKFTAMKKLTIELEGLEKKLVAAQKIEDMIERKTKQLQELLIKKED